MLPLNSVDYTKNIKSELKQIVSATEGAMGCSRVVVLKTGNINNIVSWCSFHILQVLFDFFSCLFPTYYRKQNEDTIDYFEKIFGSRRVEEISSKYNLHLDRKKIQGIPMTKSDLQTLFAGVSAVTEEDVKEMVSGIQQILHMSKDHWQVEEITTLTDDQIEGFCREFDNLGLRNIELSQDQIIELFENFEEVEFSTLTKEQVDFLYDLCNPLDYETTCLNEPRSKETGYDRGLTAEGLLPLSAQIRDVKEKIQTEESTDLLHHELNVKIMKRVVGYFNPVGLLIRMEDGWFKVEKKFYSAGMYTVLLRNIDSSKRPDKLCVLATQTLGFVPWKWEPAVEDLRVEIGSWGVMFATKLFHYIKSQVDADPNYCFDLFGYSLGGAQAQRLFAYLIAAKLHHIVHSITTFSSPGIDAETRSWIESRVEEGDMPPVVHYRDHGDLVSLVGETFLPSKKIVLISNKGNEEDPMKRKMAYYDIFEAIFLGLRSMNKEHCQLIEEHSKVLEITDEVQIANILDNTPLGWEHLRNMLADLFSEKVFVEWLDKVEETAS
ncbi:MAG: hypothetical protein HY860_03780 [Chlamydiales bacterium]|nr:hypothetical protein [Chlamydiales bacterium]